MDNIIAKLSIHPMFTVAQKEDTVARNDSLILRKKKEKEDSHRAWMLWLKIRRLKATICKFLHLIYGLLFQEGLLFIILHLDYLDL